jgi:sugar transferase (PEP-CTERM/EpsH1 system associated)
VIHTRNWGGSDGIVAARLAGIRSIVHGEHGWDPGDPDGKNPRRLKWRRRFGNMARELTCVSKDIARWLSEDVGVKRPVTQIYNGVDVDAFCAGDGGGAIRRELGVAPDAFLAGIVGRLDPIKDHPTLFEAFDTATAGDANARLIVVGDGPERERLDALAGDRILMLGNRRDVPAVMQALDLFVLPSWNEGISNTILEAMACSLPVLATRVGGNPELVDPEATGTLVPAKDVAALAAGLAAYHGSRQFGRTHGSAGRERVCEKFSVKAMVQSYEQVWRRAATP